MVDSSGFEVNCLDYGFSPHFAWCVDIASVGTDRQTQIQGRWTDGGAPPSTLSSNGSGRAPGTQNRVPAGGFPLKRQPAVWPCTGPQMAPQGLRMVQNQPSGSYIPVWSRTNPHIYTHLCGSEPTLQVHSYLCGSEPTLRLTHTCAVQNQPSGPHIPACIER